MDGVGQRSAVAAHLQYGEGGGITTNRIVVARGVYPSHTPISSKGDASDIKAGREQAASSFFL